MTETITTGTREPHAAGSVCAQCAKTFATEEMVASGERIFCRACYQSLRAELEAVVAAMSTDVNYFMASVGAVLGGAVGALVWWGFTVTTHIAFGLVAVIIGFLVGHGAVRFAGGKRSRGLQALSIVVAVASYLLASYLVNMTFINRAMAEQGESLRVSFPPDGLLLFVRVISLGFGLMDLVFLGIVVYQAWAIPRPILLPPEMAS